MDPLTLKIRGNLHKYRQQTQAKNLAQWKIIQAVSLTAALVLIGVSLVPSSWPFRHAIQLLVFSPMLMVTSLYFFLQRAENRVLQLSLLAFIFSLLSLAGAYLFPSSADVPSWIALLIPLVSHTILYNIFRDNPHQSRRYSVRPLNWEINIAIGAFIGAIVAAHEYLILNFIPGIQVESFWLSFQKMTWLVGIMAGLVVPAEELLLRGAAFSIFHDDLNHNFRQTLLQIGFFNLMLILALGISNIASEQWIPLLTITLMYKVVLTFLNVFMIERWRNIWASGAAALVFYVAIGRVFFL